MPEYSSPHWKVFKIIKMFWVNFTPTVKISNPQLGALEMLRSVVNGLILNLEVLILKGHWKLLERFSLTLLLMDSKTQIQTSAHGLVNMMWANPLDQESFISTSPCLDSFVPGCLTTYMLVDSFPLIVLSGSSPNVSRYCNTLYSCLPVNLSLQCAHQRLLGRDHACPLFQWCDNVQHAI